MSNNLSVPNKSLIDTFLQCFFFLTRGEIVCKAEAKEEILYADIGESLLDSGINYGNELFFSISKTSCG